MKKHKYLVKVTTKYYDDGFLYETTVKYYDTFAVSIKQALNNVRYRVIGKKFNFVDHYPYSDRYSEQYTFEVDE